MGSSKQYAHCTSKRFREAGFSAIEFLVVLLTLAAVLKTSLAFYHNYKIRSYNYVALSDYRNVKNTLLDMTAELDYALFNFEGPTSLPSPLEQAVLTSGVVLDFAYREISNGDSESGDILSFQLHHKGGNIAYLYTEVDGVVLEQVIALNASIDNGQGAGNQGKRPKPKKPKKPKKLNG